MSAWPHGCGHQYSACVTSSSSTGHFAARAQRTGLQQQFFKRNKAAVRLKLWLHHVHTKILQAMALKMADVKELPKLPYSYYALEPYIDAKTMEVCAACTVHAGVHKR